MVTFKEFVQEWVKKYADKKELVEIKELIDQQLTINMVQLADMAMAIKNNKDEYKFPMLAAVKAVKEKTGWSLKESKDFVDSIQ